MARLCETFHTLPQVGGLLDQDALLVHYLIKIQEADNIKAKQDQEHK